MALRSDKQLQQVNNILKTLIEATEHFKSLARNKELNQSIFIFSSIVEGFGTINNTIDSINKNKWINQKGNLEKSLLLIAKHLEQANFLKITEIIQFSLSPQLNKMQANILEKLGEQEQNKRITIGVFNALRNPRDFYTTERIQALIAESDKQNTQLLFFTSSDVDFEKKEVTAEVYIKGEWEKIHAPFPDIINNVGGGKRTHIDRKLRREIPFTSFYVGNKFSLPKRIVQYRTYAELLVPFKVCMDEEDVHLFIKENNKVVFKALTGNRGEDIYFVTKKGSRYIVLEHKKERIYNQESFNHWLDSIILKKKGSYVIQRYIHTRTKNNEPYHIRAHVQKDGSGQWILTHIYPSIGNRKSNLSNIARDGRVEDLHTFMIDQYGEKGVTYEQDILKLSLEIAHHLDKLHGLVLDELGIDFAIDETGRYWMHEANNGPQTAYHEEKRAVHTIAYARYIAENGIMHTNKEVNAKAGFFQSKLSKLPKLKDNLSISLGILIGEIVSDELAMKMVQLAQQANIRLFSFKPTDIDFDSMLIRGSFYEDGQWIEKIAEYPDVIFDRLKLRGIVNLEMIYEELEDIPFTNGFPSYLYNRSNIFEQWKNQVEYSEKLFPYQKAAKTRDVTKFIENYGKSIIKLDNISKTSNGYYIEKKNTNEYVVTIPKSQKTYRELPFQNFIKEKIEEGNFIIQKNLNEEKPLGETFRRNL